MNIVLEDTLEVVSTTATNPLGMVVVRGNSIIMMECLEKVI